MFRHRSAFIRESSKTNEFVQHLAQCVGLVFVRSRRLPEEGTSVPKSRIAFY